MSNLYAMIVCAGAMSFFIIGPLFLFSKKLRSKKPFLIGISLMIVGGYMFKKASDKEESLIKKARTSEEIASLKNDYSEISSRFNHRHDKFEGGGWYEPKAFSGIPPQGTKRITCFVSDDGSTFIESFYSEYGSPPSLFHSSASILIGEDRVKTHEVNILNKDSNIYEFGELVLYPPEDSHIVAEIGSANGKKVEFRLNGRSSYADGTLNKSQVSAFSDCAKLSEIITVAKNSKIDL